MSDGTSAVSAVSVASAGASITSAVVSVASTGASVVSGSVPQGEETYTATGLSIGSTYTVDLIVVDVNGNKSTKVTKTFQTSDIVLGSVSSLAATASGQVITATWTDPSSDLTGVRVSVFDGDTLVETSDIAKATETFTTSQTLTADHEYKITAVPYKTLEDAVLLGTSSSVTCTTEA